MLVLSRREAESIRFPQLEVEIRVMGLRKSRVQLGIIAPKEIMVSRGELSAQSRTTSYADVEQERLRSELARLETELLVLAEMASAKDRNEAIRIAGEAIERVGGIKRSMHLASRSETEPVSISELVAVRAEVIDRLRICQPKKVRPTECVRQNSADYYVPPVECVVA